MKQLAKLEKIKTVEEKLNKNFEMQKIIKNSGKVLTNELKYNNKEKNQHQTRQRKRKNTCPNEQSLRI